MMSAKEMEKEIKLIFIKGIFKINFVNPNFNPNPFTLKIPSPFGKFAYVDIDYDHGAGSVHLTEVPATAETLAWLDSTGSEIYQNHYPEVFSSFHQNISKELESAARFALEYLKYFAGRDEIADEVASKINHFEFSVDGDKFLPIPTLFGGSVIMKTQISITPQVAEELQEGINNGFTPFLAMRHLYRAMQESNPRFKWIDATIAAELAVKEALIRKRPDLEKLIVEMPSPPLDKLYGSILEEYMGSESPFKKKIKQGAEKRNHLVHRPREAIVTKIEANDYVNDVRRAIHHLYGLLYPEWGVIKRLIEIEKVWISN
jgi:hypothetical protein